MAQGLGIAACTAPAPAPAPAFGAAHAAAVRDSASAFLEQFGRLSRAAEWDSLGALYSDRPDFTFLESGLVQYASAQAVREALRSVPPGQFIDTQYDTLTIVPLAPGVAVVSGTFTTRFAERAGDAVQTLFSYGGALSLVLHHEPDGWRVARGIRRRWCRGGRSAAAGSGDHVTGATPVPRAGPYRTALSVRSRGITSSPNRRHSSRCG